MSVTVYSPISDPVSLLGKLGETQRKTISLQLTSTSCRRIWMLCVARVAKSKPPISSVNTPITGLPFCSEPKRLQRALSQRQCVFDFLSHTWFVSQPHMTMAVAATSCTKAEVAEGVKREPTDPHKQALSFMASVTPSLLKPDSQTFKHHWRALLFFSSNTITLLLPHNSLTPEKLLLVSSLAFTPCHPMHTESFYTQHVCVHTLHTYTREEGEEVSITLLSRMQEKFMLLLERERGILCELRWAIILFNVLFLGTCLPPVFLLVAAGIRQHFH